jgi:hypothetical protein
MKRKKCAGVFLSGAEASFIYWRERHDLKFVPPPEPFMRYVAEQHRDQRRGTGVSVPESRFPLLAKAARSGAPPGSFYPEGFPSQGFSIARVFFAPRVFDPTLLKRPE